MKSEDKTRRRRSAEQPRKRNRPVSKRLSRLMDDDNTTNSEASDHGVFTDINWEENLEVDTTELLDEFAPQALPRPVKRVYDVQEDINEVSSNEVKVEDACLVEDLADVDSLSDFHINLEILVQNYKSDLWVEGVVEEIDWDEEEILVRYQGEGDHPKEWLSMSSQRIKKNKKEVTKYIDEATLGKVIESSGNTEKVAASELLLLHPRVPPPLAVPSPPAVPLPKLTIPVLPRPTRPVLRVKKRLPLGKIIKRPTYKKPISLSVKVKNRSKLQVPGKVSRRLPIWKTHTAVSVSRSLSSSGHGSSGKFSEGEKVLAKWSDHRMQKFPAVIKKNCGGGLYDVLFYDGFEKTLSEENVFKTTDEEIAKYKESKPSEADSFIDMDVATSKQERRQKKRKTFDDFFEEKDLKRKKKPNVYDLNSSESFLRASLVRGKPVLHSLSIHNTKSYSRVPGSPKNLPVTPKPSPLPHSSPPHVDSQKPLVPDSSLSPALPPVELSTENKMPPIINETKEDPLTEEQAVSSDAIVDQPLEIICHDGVIRKSILIEDDNLPSGWTKHAIAWVENVWACFLFTPDKYAVHSLIELKKYFKVSEGREPPEGLDFSYPKESLQELMEAQKDSLAIAGYRKWVNKELDEKKIFKKVRILPPSRSAVGYHHPIKRVRTLLPRFRTQSGSSKFPEGKVWSCPKSECNKKFRKENLLHMHIKHYHSDLSELAGCAPNVVDLALARSAESTWSPEPSKRTMPKSPVYEQVSNKSNDQSNSMTPEITNDKALNASRSGELHAVSPSSSSAQGSVQFGNGTFKTLNPKIPKHKPDGDSESIDSELDLVFTEKSRLHGAPKPSAKKIFDHKPNEDSGYLAGSRNFKKKQQPIEKIHTSDSNDGFLDEESREDGVIFERLQNEEIINCTCGFREEDGLMVQCEICLCWQHGICHGMEKDSDVPERYVCSVCLDPLHVRTSQRYSYANHYLTLTKLPRFSYRTCNEDALRHRERVLSKSFELTSNLQNIHKMERALTAKINIAQQSDHPKLYLWSTNWDSPGKKSTNMNMKKHSSDSVEKSRRGPVGEEPIESIDCRLRLLDRIESDQQDMESRLTIIQAQLQALESEDFDITGEEREGGGDPLLKQAVYMLLRDLNTLSTAASLS